MNYIYYIYIFQLFKNMSTKARHLQILEDSKKDEYNLNRTSKIKDRIIQIQDARYDEARQQANNYAISMGQNPPNKLSYEK